VNKLNHLLDMLEQNSADSFLLFAVAKTYANLQDFENAIIYYERLHAADPNYIGQYLHWAAALEKLNKPELAISILKMGIVTANRIHDLHALSELKSALMELDDLD
jgi:tetratricopeptide (TPR) repeat protein